MPIIGAGTDSDPRQAKHGADMVSNGYRVTIMDYGPEALCLFRLIPEPSVTDHNTLVADAEVIAFPLDLSESLPPPGQSSLDESLEALNLPVNWMTPASDYLLLLKRIAAYFLIMQRVAGASGDYSAEIFSGNTLATQMNELPSATETGFFDAVDFFGLSSNGLNGNSTLRQFLNQVGHQFDIEMSFINDGE